MCLIKSFFTREEVRISVSFYTFVVVTKFLECFDFEFDKIVLFFLNQKLCSLLLSGGVYCGKQYQPKVQRKVVRLKIKFA